MDDALKPCPFCGGEAFLCTKERPYPWVARCNDCQATSGGTTFQNDKWNAECWNTRADLPATDAQIAAHPKVKALVEALQWYENHRLDAMARATVFSDLPEDPAVLALCQKHGYGAVIDSACRQWANMPKGGSGAFFVCGCIADTAARDALAAMEQDQ